MVDKERVEQYKRWFDNLSFFQNNSFILDEIENLWNLVLYILNVYDKFCDKEDFYNGEYTKLNMEDSVKLSQEFFDRHNIPINLLELINSETIILQKDEKRKDDFFGIKKDGHSYKNESDEKKVSVILEESILDSAVMVHEVCHYRNQPVGKRNFVSDLLTESISYAMELIFFEDLENTEYCSDRSLHFRLLEKVIHKYSGMMYYIYKIVLVYKKEKDISEEAYNKVFSDGKYYKTLEYFEKYVNNRNNILRDTWYVLGLPISVYMLMEYRKDKNFMNNIEEFNSIINKNDLWECFKSININSKEEFIEKIKSSSDNFTSLLDLLYMSNYKK